jgi:protocatechuate 3,4-dioxygenase beta subunit
MNQERHGRLASDLATLARRRQILGWLASAGALAAVGCNADATDASGSGGSGGSGSGSGSGGGSSTSGSGSCKSIPEETGGPYPADGTNGPNVLVMDGIVRSDITESLDGGGTAEGVPLTVTLKLADTASGCAALADAAVYLWHCNAIGEYSLYSAAITDETYLRGVQVAGADGTVTFTTIFPGAYSGRWPHIHFEVYESLEAAQNGDRPLATSQIALPAGTCDEVYATSGYEASVANFASESLSTGNVFQDDGGVLQTPSVSGDASSGFAIELDVAV